MIFNKLTIQRSRNARVLLLGVWLYMHTPRLVSGEDAISYKYQKYLEANDRIDVISHYLLFEKSLTESTEISVEWLENTITGATPTGRFDPDNGTVPLSDLEDVREGKIFKFSQGIGDHEFTFEYSNNEESDYESRGYALSSSHAFFQKSTTLSLGAAWLDDEVRTLDFTTEGKTIKDFFIGVSQIIDRNTLASLNVSFGVSEGYLNDPYKVATFNYIDPLFGFALFNEFPENRPTRREHWSVLGSVIRHIDPLDASIDASYRYFDDDYGIQAHTASLKWLQNLGPHFVVIPSVRFHSQSAADFFAPFFMLPPGALPADIDKPSGAAPYYSADYRLSKLTTESYGLKVVFRPKEWIEIDAGYEYYEMRGQSSGLPDAAYPNADIFTIGARLFF